MVSYYAATGGMSGMGGMSGIGGMDGGMTSLTCHHSGTGYGRWDSLVTMK